LPKPKKNTPTKPRELEKEKTPEIIIEKSGPPAPQRALPVPFANLYDQPIAID
jgi:hypothetical protein